MYSPQKRYVSTVDRFIPQRTEKQIDLLSPTKMKTKKKKTKYTNSGIKKDLHLDILKYELLDGFNDPNEQENSQNFLQYRKNIPKNVKGLQEQVSKSGEKKSPKTKKMKKRMKTPNRNLPKRISPRYSLSPLSKKSEQLIKRSQSTKIRKFPTKPFRILEAPGLRDDYYLNLLDWGTKDLAVALGRSVYLWSPTSSDVTKLCKMDGGNVSCVKWIQRGTHVSVGTEEGTISLVDVEKQKIIRTFTDHHERVGRISWKCHLMTSGSKQGKINIRDVRSKESVVSYQAHSQEVCGLEWNQDESLASGGNDNLVKIWSMRRIDKPMGILSGHTAGIKALTWVNNNFLLSGGGSRDQTIKSWSIRSMSCKKTVSTGSQVTNIHFSKNSNEILTTHGFSLNQINLWKYPSFKKITSIPSGHTTRILFFAINPTGEIICTGAGDETVRLWKMFPKPRQQYKKSGLKLANNFR
ncbi:cell division cycle 20 cdc20 fizzy -related [Anaeramoeba flamelloides]|uniref:Cell division cycle 20 cdc20 fizzy -related n=1 Tax=Anaeramoeba flamelloides TaxID=1746091 RepID=A0AAV7ZJF2_9EUKA|nr:cell division cycle 20 cdc20 fizzy -related [Anaeramoeba flamelloides]